MTVGKLMVVLGLDKTGFNTGLNSATKEATLFSKATDKTFKLIGKAAKISLAAIGAALIKGTVDAAKYEKSLANVATMLDEETMPMMEEFKKSLIDISEAYGEGTDTLAKGLYDILSASIPASEALDVLETSAKAAKAGLTDTGVAADAITTLMNSFGDATKDAQYYSDILFSSVLYGKTTFNELAPSIGNVAKLMETAGGSAEEMAGMLSIMTRNGIDTRTAITNLRGILTALLKPTEELTTMLNGMTVEADGFTAVMEKIGSLPPADLAEMFPNVRALTGVVVAARDMGEEVDKITKLMSEGSPTMDAYNKQTDTLAFVWDQFKATLKATSVTIGNELLPTAKELFTGMIKWLQENRDNVANFAKAFVDGVKSIVSTIYSMRDVILGLGTAVLGLMVVEKVTTLMASFGIATSVALGPVAAVAAAVGLLVAGFVSLKRELKEQREEQELLQGAQRGTLDNYEDYNSAIEIQRKKIADLTSAHQANIDRLRQSGMVTEDQIKIAEQAYQSNMRLAQGKLTQMMLHADQQKQIDDEAAARAREAEEEELRAHFEYMQNLSAEEAAEMERAAEERRQAEERSAIEKADREAEEARLLAIEEERQAIINANRYASMSEQEKHDAEIKHLQELGLSHHDLIEYLRREYPNLYEDIQEVSEETTDAIVSDQEKAIQIMQASFDGLTDVIEADAEDMTSSFMDMAANIAMLFGPEGMVVAEILKAFNALGDLLKAFVDDVNGDMESYADTVVSVQQKILNAYIDANDQILKNTKKRLQDELDAGKISQEDYDAAVDAAEKERDRANKEYKVELAKMERDITLAEIEIARQKAIADLGWFNRKKKTEVNELYDTLVSAINAIPLPSYIRGGLVGLVNGGVFEGNPGIDTSLAMMTDGEYVMPPQQTRDNYGELEAMRKGESRSMVINPMPLYVDVDGRNIFKSTIEFFTEESDNGNYRINPKVLRVDA